LPKPFREEHLLQAINAAIALDREARRKRSELAELQKHYSLLTPREREVLRFVIAGFVNKQTAGTSGPARSRSGFIGCQIMRKMGPRSLAELVRMADKLALSRGAGQS
jgi:FixJ family two-component response regulator